MEKIEILREALLKIKEIGERDYPNSPWIPGANWNEVERSFNKIQIKQLT